MNTAIIEPMVTVDEKAAFSERLNTALDMNKVPPKGKGRQFAVQKIIASEGGTVSQKGARKWLENESIPAMDNLIKLAKACGVSFEWLATGRNSPTRESLSPGINEPIAPYLPGDIQKATDLLLEFDWTTRQEIILYIETRKALAEAKTPKEKATILTDAAFEDDMATDVGTDLQKNQK